MQAAKYDFSEEYQRNIVSLCLKDPTFIRNYEDILDPNYFDKEYLSSIVRIAVDHVAKYGQVPSRPTILEEIKRFCRDYKIGLEEAKAIIGSARTLYALDVSDPDSVKDRVIEFGRTQAMKQSIMRMAELVDSGFDADKARVIFDKAINVGQSCTDLGIQVSGQFSDLPTMIAASGIADNTRKIPTGISAIDAATFGGPGRKEIWIALALPGIGKSQWLVNMGASAILRGLPVIHVTVGDLDEIDVFHRYAARLTKVPMHEITLNSEEYKKRAAKLDQYLERYLRIKYYASHSVTASMIYAYVSRLVTIDNIKPALIIVDYPDEFKPQSDNDYQNMGRVYSELSKLASDFNALIWTASQVQRTKNEEATIRQDNVADSWRKAHKADGIVSLNQTVDEYRAGRMRLWVDKVRRARRKNFFVHLYCDFDISYLREMSDDEIQKEESDIVKDVKETLAKQEEKRSKYKSVDERIENAKVG